MSEIRYKCAGCQREEIHKMCPAFGTPLYMSGNLFTKEDEEKYKEIREKALSDYVRYCEINPYADLD